MENKIKELIYGIEKELVEYRQVLRKENVEKGIENLIELLYGKLSDEDVRILEMHTLLRQKEILKKLLPLTGSQGEKDE